MSEAAGKHGPRPRALIVAGPTCSGKSALAMHLARRLGGTVINADSMQVYRELRVLTARPTVAEEASVPHGLYGVRPAAEAGTVAWWREEALRAMAGARLDGRVPILCGGTGLYLASLSQGLADIPDPGLAAREEARGLIEEIGALALHARLTDADPRTAAGLQPQDSQRVARAWEVWRGTGLGLAGWRARQAAPAGDWDFAAVLLDPPRAPLREAIADRFAVMIEAGALAEVRALVAQNLSPALPAMRAHGVGELAAHLRGEITLNEASRRAITATGQYTKRQATWFRHRLVADETRTHRFIARYAFQAQLVESIEAVTIPFICGLG